MGQRYAISVAVGLVITFALLTLMQSLVAQGRGGLGEKRKRINFDFLRVAKQEQTQTKERKLPNKKPPTPEALEMELAQDTSGGDQSIEIPDTMFRADLSLAGGPTLGAGADADVIPLVRVNPRYPPRAQSRGIEGWVYLEFTITPQGTTSNIVVLDSDPKGYFERSAVNAVKKYKYKPRVEEGKAVSRPGVQVVISFDIEE